MLISLAFFIVAHKHFYGNIVVIKLFKFSGS